ncbi:MAG: endolytic transglycosylase MltG [Acetobacteraceae bacterium]|nr:endolytic transglycosylase MltG [Acetobacteraceae bacterium]MSP29322.1 endolytic transglycosylase MltG [Acetobacteraceae bacterium]
MKVVLVLAVPVLLVAGATATIWYRLEAPGPLTQARDIVVPRGGLGTTADALAREGVIDDPLLFRLLALVTHKDGELRAGEFSFPTQARLAEVLHVLRTARPVQHRLTIPEGLTARQIVHLLNQATTLAGDSPAIEEGSLLPQTYAFERGTQRAAVTARAKGLMNKALADAWAARIPGLPLADAREALVLASIVERETAKPNERPRVAAVFLNRLRQGMRLQSDPTVVYAASDGAGVLDHPITRADLDHDSPFNTYKIKGLPPTPISAPGAASIQAVLHPETTDELYFVADGTGGHAFARTMEDHNRNVARWRALANPPAR